MSLINPTSKPSVRAGLSSLPSLVEPGAPLSRAARPAVNDDQPAAVTARAKPAEQRGARARHARGTSGVQSQLAASLPAAAKGQVFSTAKGTGYYPANSRMEGGFVDKRDTKLNTLQDYLEGKAPYVSIAMDKNLYKNGALKYGDKFRIPELEKKYGRPIEFRAVDTGGAFTGKGGSRVDICTRDKKASLDPTVNGKLTLVKLDGDMPRSAKTGDFSQQLAKTTPMTQRFGAGAARAKSALNRQERATRQAFGAAAGGASPGQVAGYLGGDAEMANLIASMLLALESGDPAAIRGASDQLSRKMTSRARSQLGPKNTSAQVALDKMAPSTGPITPGTNGTAAFDSTSKTGARNQMKSGRITVNGNTYNFNSGGHGRGNLPPGDYKITKHMQSRGDRSMNVGGVGYSFAMSDKYDPRVGGTRSLLRIHPDGGSKGTMGCVGIVGDAATQAQFRRDMNAEIERNGGSYTLRVG